MSQINEVLIDKIQKLPLDKVTEVLDFVDVIEKKHLQTYKGQRQKGIISIKHPFFQLIGSCASNNSDVSSNKYKYISRAYHEQDCTC